MKKVIIVGGGFAGLNLAKFLSGNTMFQVTLVDINNYHYFPPLLYQVSTAFIEPSNISYPFRKLFQKHTNIRFFMGELKRILADKNRIVTSNGSLSYDYLVLCIGTEVNFYGNKNIRKNALPMKTIDDALRIRNHILLRLEESIRAKSMFDKMRLTNIVIAGGGPTGVEMAGMLAEMRRSSASRDYPELDVNQGSIYLINSRETPLGPMSKMAQTEAYRTLEKLGVKIITETLVKDYQDDKVLLSNGGVIHTATLIWCSGVIGKEVHGLDPEVITKDRRVVVDQINRVSGYKNIFTIGDLCYQTTEDAFPKGHPQVAQVAIQQGKCLGRNLIRLEKGISTTPFTYNDHGMMAIISKYKAVADLRYGSVKGPMAWLIWLFIHLLPLVNFRNRFKVLFNWGLSFFTRDAAIRLIIRPESRGNGKVVI